jgi:hypothetical protein
MYLFASAVAQTDSLPYRRLVIGRASAYPHARRPAAALQDSILRHSRLPICVTLNKSPIRWEKVSGGRMRSGSSHFLRNLELVRNSTRKLFSSGAPEIAEGLLNLRQEFVVG